MSDSQREETILLTLPRSKQLGPLIPLILHELPRASLRLGVTGDYKSKAEELLAILPDEHRNRVHVVPCDLTNLDQVTKAVAGTTVVIHNGPPMHALETNMGLNVVHAASEQGSTVRHLIFCSVIHPLRVKMTNHAAKLAVEERILESGLDYTILRPTHVMQNLNLKAVMETGVITVPYDSAILHGFLDLFDLQAVILSVLKDLEKHNRATYELVGINGTYEDVASAFRSVTGKAYNVQQVVPSDAHLTALGFSHPYQQEAMKRMLFYYTYRGLPGNSNVLKMLLGREPTGWEGYLSRELAKLSM